MQIWKHEGRDKRNKQLCKERGKVTEAYNKWKESEHDGGVRKLQLVKIRCMHRTKWKLVLWPVLWGSSQKHICEDKCCHFQLTKIQNTTVYLSKGKIMVKEANPSSWEGWRVLCDPSYWEHFLNMSYFRDTLKLSALNMRICLINSKVSNQYCEHCSTDNILFYKCHWYYWGGFLWTDIRCRQIEQISTVELRILSFPLNTDISEAFFASSPPWEGQSQRKRPFLIPIWVVVLVTPLLLWPKTNDWLRGGVASHWSCYITYYTHTKWVLDMSTSWFEIKKGCDLFIPFRV